MVSLGTEDFSFQTPKNFFGQYVLSSADDPNCKEPNTKDMISFPNSNAFVDFDGDCMPDLFLTRQNGTQNDKS